MKSLSGTQLREFLCLGAKTKVKIIKLSMKWKLQICPHSKQKWASLVVQLVTNPPAMQKTLEDLLQKGQANHSSILGLPWWFSC